jgi:hypothetical protein
MEFFGFEEVALGADLLGKRENKNGDCTFSDRFVCSCVFRGSMSRLCLKVFCRSHGCGFDGRQIGGKW